MILRSRIPREDYKFRIPGGSGFLKVLCIVPICVAVFAFFVNGSDYYTGGMVGIVTGPLLYFIWRRMYGGLSAKNPDAFPMNAKTRLAVGDTRRMSFLFLVVTIMNIVALIFEPWYEDWGGPDAWGSGDYFDGILEAQNVDTIVMIIKTVLIALTIVCALACIILYAISKKVEPSKEECKAVFKSSCEYISDRFNAELEASNAAIEAAEAAANAAETKAGV